MIKINIEQIIKLPNNHETKKQIEEILEHAILTISEYQKLIIKLMEIHFSLANFNDVIKIGQDYYHSPKFDNTLNNDLLFKTIIDAAFSSKKYNILYDYIQIRKENLPIMDRYLAALDLIKFKKNTNQPYANDILDLLSENLSNDIKAKLLNELLDLYIKTNNDNKVIPLIEELKKYDPYKTYIPNYLKTLYNLKLYDEAKEIANKYLKDQKFQKDAVITLLKIYTNEDDYHLTTILDADYKNTFETWDLEDQLVVYELLIKIYLKHNNKFSANIYQKLKNNLKKNKQTKTKKETVIEKDDTLNNVSIKVPRAQLKHLNSIIDLIHKSHQIPNTSKLRDFLRDFFIQVENHLNFKELLVFTERDYTLYHYKKNRLYDKTLNKAIFENTLIEEVLKTGNELFGTYSDFSKFNNIITNTLYNEETKYIYAFPIFDLGVFIIHLDEVITDPATYYDLLKGINNIIFTILNDYQNFLKLESDNYFLKQLFNSKLFALRIIDENHQSLNPLAEIILNDTTNYPLESFLSNLNIKESSLYKDILKDLFLTENKQRELTYSYKDKQIKETFISIKDNNKIKIVSLINDLTNIIKERQGLINDAIIDYETSLPNLNALNNDFSNYLKEKGSLILINFNESILPIYGFETTLAFFKEFGQITKKIFNEGTLYRFDTYSLFLYIPYNDIRTVSNLLKEYLKEINKYESKTISYEKFKPKMAVIRYPVVTNEKNPAKLYRYLELTLDYLKRTHPNYSYYFFEYDIYEREIYEQQVIDILNDAIKNKRLTLSFNQIIDNNNYVFKYESTLSLDNFEIDTKYLYQIAKKRNRLFDFEIYHLETVLRYLKTLEEETKQLIKVVIPLTKETIKNNNFNPLFFELIKKYQIPIEFISILITDINLSIKDISLQIDELYKNGLTLETTNINSALKGPFKTLYLEYDNSTVWLNYLKILNNYLNNIDLSLVIVNTDHKDQREKLTNLGIKYVKGSLYKTINSDRLLLKIKNLN
ncbi:MAG: hypothetical protein WC907_00480 [Acholeplasmataceae bacterium]